MSESKAPVDRRSFIRSSASVAMAGASLTLAAASYGRVSGSNERINLAFLGAGGRAQAHLNLINRLREEGQNLACVGICDVWDGLEEEYQHEYPPGKFTRRRYAQGLFPSARKMGLNPQDKKRVVKDYRRLLDLSEVDAVCISTPDHWHAQMCLDAAEAGKHLYCEKPMTRTAEEALAVLETFLRHNNIVTVGTQILADPEWQRVSELLKANQIGHVVQGQTGVHRTDPRGLWRYYRVTPEMNPSTIDWKLFLGSQFKGVDGKPLSPEIPFDATRFAQWRCYGSFCDGLVSDLLVHPLTKMMAAMGLDFPSRVSASGGLYLERDGRDAPDLVSAIVEYADRGCQLLLSTSAISNYPIEEVIRGRDGAIRFQPKGIELFRDQAAPETISIEKPRDNTRALWLNFLDCIRTENRKTLSPPDLAAAVSTTLAMISQSQRTGRSLGWDREIREAIIDN
jgi:predicted dehydrogenase